jgi:putative ABC transport system substrate-binding protein
MRRREFITLLGGAAAAWPLAARAQQSTMPVIGFLNSASPEAFGLYVEAFAKGLQESGFVEGQNVAIEYRWARGRYDQLPSLAADLVERKVTVIAANGEPAVAAARAATSSIPIAFLIGGDPVRLGFVASFNRPTGNATGVTMLTIALNMKRLGILREALPNAATFAVLLNPTFPGSDERTRAVQEGAHSIGQHITVAAARTENEINQAFANFDRSRPDALLVAGDPFFNARRDQIVALAAQRSIPAIYEWREFATSGGLMSYGTYLTDVYRQQGSYAGRILKGENPASLPVQQPVKFGLVVNLKTAKALGLDIPPNLLARADEVIE